MSTIDRLQAWNRRGIITEAQFGTLSALIRKERFSVFCAPTGIGLVEKRFSLRKPP